MDVCGVCVAGMRIRILAVAHLGLWAQAPPPAKVFTVKPAPLQPIPFTDEYWNEKLARLRARHAQSKAS